MKRKHYLLAIILAITVLFSGFHNLEDPFTIRLKEALRSYNATYPEEKVYVQLDKPFYKPGEDIWFNAFVLNSNDHTATSISDVVYVELIDPKGSVTSRLNLPVKEGTANGDFALSPSAPGGVYQIRAYTRWMKNFGENQMFTREVQVQRIVTPRLLLKLEFDRESYHPGENVSTKITVTNLKNERANNAMVNVHVQLNGKRVSSINLHSDSEGVASMQFRLPDTLNTTDGLLYAKVTSMGTEESISRSIPIVLNKVSLQFFPEGGTWVRGVNSTIAFKALNEYGRSADVSGVIVDNNDQVVTEFTSYHMGMGSIKLKPKDGVTYFARLNHASGSQTVVPLPDPAATGFVLNLQEQTDSTVQWAIHSAVNTEAHLVARAHGEIVYSQQLILSKGENTWLVNTASFPVGISSFTLFDASGVEQCERLIFANGNNGLQIELNTDKNQYGPRDEVQLRIRTTNHQGKPMSSKLSLAVVDDQLISFADDKQDNLLSSMLLSSEVKGEIQEPSFYFDQREPKAPAALNYLLMTQGWRRFTWKEVASNNRPILYTAERNRDLSGQLHSQNGTGIVGKVTLIELGGKKRIANVRTTSEGHFVFRNIDPTINLLLLSRKNTTLVLTSETPLAVSLNDKDGTVLLPSVESDLTSPVAEEREIPDDTSEEGEMDLSLATDVTQLSELIVTAYGGENKRDFSASVVSIRESSIESKFAASSIENVLQGRVAGVLIAPQTGNPGAQSNIYVRGLSSLGAGRNEPLYLVDGHPMGSSLNQNFSNMGILGPEDIQSIEVINSPEATAIYGSAAANGAIVITTRSRLGNYYFSSPQKSPAFASLKITPRRFSPTREYYSPPPSSYQAGTRRDFRTTVFWNHSIVTDKNGEASIRFFANDAVSAFRITVEGFSGSGLLGRKETVYHTELPLSMDIKLPEVLGFEDTLKLPVRVKNVTPTVQSATVALALPDQLMVKEPLEQTIQIDPLSTGTVWFTIHSSGIKGRFPVTLKLQSDAYTDEIKEIIQVDPVGFPMRASFSGKELDKTFRLTIQDAERNTVKSQLVAYPDVLSDLFTGVESILSEPHGCFEQVSSSTFPNILALQFMNQTGVKNRIFETRALSFIKDGYSRLIAYEIRNGGFEWFGHPPAHEGLTAYGLLQFHEMKKVFPGVSEKVMTRTRDWLQSRRNGKGGYLQNAGKYGFSGASEAVTNAFIIYALSETGAMDIVPEYNHAITEVSKSKDMYRMALVAAAAYNLGQYDDYERLVGDFKKLVDQYGLSGLKSEHSLVRSYGKSLEVETISLWALALMKASSPDLMLIDACIRHVLSSRSYGQFGSTQGTTQALMALTAYAKCIRTTREAGTFQVFSDSSLVGEHSYEKEENGKIVLTDFVAERQGNQELRVKFEGTKEPLPYSIDVEWHTKMLPSSERCPVSLGTSLSERVIQLNETVRLDVSLKNTTDGGLPMTVAVIGIPAGLATQPWQLKELQEKKAFDFYEINSNSLVLYFRELDAREERKITFDLKAEIPGSYLGAASTSYLYYMNEFRHWVSGKSITIQ